MNLKVTIPERWKTQKPMTFNQWANHVYQSVKKSRL